jgi:hypothetical protein
VSRPTIAKLDARTGAVDPDFQPAMRGGRVSEIRLVDGRLLVGGTFRQKLIALNPITGRNTGYLDVPIDGRLDLTTSKTEVYRFAVDPAGSRLIGVGNFTTVGGENRKRAFMLNLGADRAVLSPWYYAPLDKKCRSNTPTRQPYLDDVDFSPNASYFVFGATGYVPATDAEIGTAVCDAVARFETDVLAPVKPTWINYTGGDTIHSVAATGAAVYVQGHFRWLDNPPEPTTRRRSAARCLADHQWYVRAAVGGGDPVDVTVDQRPAAVVEQSVVDGVHGIRSHRDQVVEHLTDPGPRCVHRQQQCVHRLGGDGEGVTRVEHRAGHQVSQVRHHRDARVDEGVLPAMGGNRETTGRERLPHTDGVDPLSVLGEQAGHRRRAPDAQVGPLAQQSRHRVDVEVVRVLVCYQHGLDAVKRLLELVGAGK